MLAGIGPFQRGKTLATGPTDAKNMGKCAEGSVWNANDGWQLVPCALGLCRPFAHFLMPLPEWGHAAAVPSPWAKPTTMTRGTGNRGTQEWNAGNCWGKMCQ